MPAIPEFLSTQGYGATPLQQTNPGADSQGAEAFAAGGQEVAGAAINLDARLQDLAYRQQRNQQVVDAAAATSGAETDLYGMRLQALKDPDYATAPQRFKDGAMAYRQQTLDGITDPGTRAIVARHLDGAINTNTIGVMGDAFKTGNAQQVASLNTSQDGFVQAMARATNPADFDRSLDMMAAAQAGASNGGLISPEQQRINTSMGLRQALTLRAQTDPGGAQALMTKHAPLFTASDMVALSDHLAPRADRAADDQYVQQRLGAPTGSPDVDTLWPALTHQESGGRQTDAQGNPLTSPKGAIGVSQILPDTARQVAADIGVPFDAGRLATDPAYNQLLGKAYLNQMLTRYGGNSTLALAAYNAGPGRVDQWLDRNGDPRQGGISDAAWAAAIPIDETRNYVAAIRGRGGATLANGSQAPDLEGQIAQTQKDYAGLSIERQQYVISRFRQQASDWNNAHAGELADAHREWSNLTLGYQQGLTATPPPTDQIRALDPKHADAIIDEMNVSRQGGQQIAAIRMASPDEQNAILSQWATPGTLSGGRVRMQDGQLSGPGTVQGAAAPDQETPDQLRTRMAILGHLQQAAQQKAEALDKDPVAYAAMSPDLQALTKTLDPQDPASFGKYADASMAVQKRLGVAQPRVLTDAMVKNIVQPLLTTPPEQADVGAQVDGLAKQFGANWPQVFGELVQHGKLPSGYQLAANMDTTAQTVARQDFTRVLQMSAKKGGLSQLQADVLSPDQTKQIKDAIPGALEGFRGATRFNDGGPEQLATMRASVEHLATYNVAIKGQSPADAVENAYQGLFGAKYDTSDSMLAPKGQMFAVQQSAAGVQASLHPDDLMPLPDPTGLKTGPDQRVDAFKAAQRGFWAPNKDGSGLSLRMNGREGSSTVIRRANGAPIEIKFDALPPAPPSPDVPAEY